MSHGPAERQPAAGSSRLPIVRLLGDSHVGALVEAARRDPRGAELIAIGANAQHFRNYQFFAEDKDGVSLKGVLGERLKARTGTSSMASGTAWVLQCGTHCAHFFRRPTWQDYSLVGCSGSIDSHLLSPALLDEMIDADTQRFFSFIEALTRCGVSITVAAAPPPRLDHAALSDAETADTRKAVALRFQQRVLERIRSLRLPVVPAPSAAVDPDGFLRPEFWSPRAGDQTHANAEYGALMLGQILQALSARAGL